MPLGLYLSVPFCRSKCSFCNFASDVFSRSKFDAYVEKVCSDLRGAEQMARDAGGDFERTVDSIYFGGGTPTVLDVGQLDRLFATIRDKFDVLPGTEFTVECAPGTLSPHIIELFVRSGVNRISLGVQSFVDKEVASVGRLHKRSRVIDDIAALRAAGFDDISLDLIAGLPHQTRESWNYSLDETIASGVPHVSVYMLEVDDDSRLGRELLAGGTRYHAHHVPDDDLTAEFYETACERLGADGIAQYEISNFAQQGRESRHNLKYWTRQPYLGFGVDAHSMLRARGEGAVRFSTPDSLEGFVAGERNAVNAVSVTGSLEEYFFLGLRLMRGVSLREAEQKFGGDRVDTFSGVIADSVRDGLIERIGDIVRLTGRGKMISNEVFGRFILEPVSGNA